MFEAFRSVDPDLVYDASVIGLALARSSSAEAPRRGEATLRDSAASDCVADRAHSDDEPIIAYLDVA